MDVLKPKVICPECGSEAAFFHCALQDSECVIYDWGTLVTCLDCGIPFKVKQKIEKLEA